MSGVIGFGVSETMVFIWSVCKNSKFISRGYAPLYTSFCTVLNFNGGVSESGTFIVFDEDKSWL